VVIPADDRERRHYTEESLPRSRVFAALSLYEARGLGQCHHERAFVPDRERPAPVSTLSQGFRVQRAT